MEKQRTSYRPLKQDKGVAGLSILLASVVMVFLIGFLVMIFAIIGAQLQTSSDTPTDVTVTGEASFFNSTGDTVAGASALGFRNFAIVTATNTSSGLLIQPGNYTTTAAGVVFNATSVVWAAVTLNYTYTYDANNTATEAIADTTTALAGVTSWFPVIITIVVMVSLILLTVIIIAAIRGSGILAQGQ